MLLLYFVVEHKVTQIIAVCCVVCYRAFTTDEHVFCISFLSAILLEQCGQVRIFNSNNNDAFGGYELHQVRSAPKDVERSGPDRIWSDLRAERTCKSGPLRARSAPRQVRSALFPTPLIGTYKRCN